MDEKPDETTIIEVSWTTWQRLNARKTPGESFEDVLSDVLDIVDSVESSNKESDTETEP